MNPARKKVRKPADYLLEIEDLKIKLEDAEQTLRALRRGEVDGLVVQGKHGKQVYTLKGADESYRTLVEAMNEAAMILDHQETVLYGNRRLAELLKTPLSRVIGTKVQDFLPSSTLVLRGKAGRRQEETVLRASDQTLVPVQVSVSLAKFDGMQGRCVLVTDLTDFKERQAARLAEQRIAREEIQRHATELETSNRELEAFVYSVSHDLRAPLRHIHRYVTLVRDDHGKELDPEARDYLSRVLSSAEQMDRLIEGLLEYSRLSRGEIKFQSIDVRSVVNGVLEQLSEDVQESRARITVVEPLKPVWGDVLLLTQALTNLVSNALKFVLPASSPAVRLGTEDRGAGVRVWVEDQGIGIPPQQQKKLFQVFERLRGEEFPGTGIGLAVVKRAAERMGGSVGVESEPGKGSRFWIELRRSRS